MSDFNASLPCRPVRQAITVRATWKKGQTECDLLAGKSNVLVTRSEVEGRPIESSPHLPPFHPFQWSAVEILGVDAGDFGAPVRHIAENLGHADFKFCLGATEYLNLPASLLFGRSYDVGFTMEQAGIDQRPNPAAIVETLANIGHHVHTSEAVADGEGWKVGESPEDETEEEAEEATGFDPAALQALLAPVMGVIGNDPRAYKPLALMPLENFSARLVSEYMPVDDLHLIFVMHGVLLKPVGAI